MKDVPPQYKQTELGVIPEDWEVKQLDEIGETLIGLTYSPSEVAEDGTLVLRSSNIQKGVLSFESNVYVKKIIPDRIMVRPGDILICVRNGSRDLIGKSTMLDSRAKGMTFGAFMSVFRSRNSDYLAHFFKSWLFNYQVEQHLGATINQITNKSLNSFAVPMPPLPEQHAISVALNDVDALIASLEVLLGKKRRLIQAAMQELLTGKTRLDGFKGAWKDKSIGGTAPLQRGFDLTHKDVKAGRFPIIYSNGVDKYHHKYMIKGPGVVTGRSGTLGKVFYVESDFWPHNTTLWVTDFKDNCPKYIYLLYKYIDFSRFASGTGVPTLNRNDIHSFMVLMPPFSEQQAIAAILFDMDAELEALEQRLAKTYDLKQGMMQELLTGRTRLI